jgi:hypothetical protein
VTELPKEELLVIELYNILIPPIFAGYMVTFIAIYAHKAIGPVEVESFLLKVQNLAETSPQHGCHSEPNLLLDVLHEGGLPVPIDQGHPGRETPVP